MSSQASVYTILLINGDSGKSLRATTCLIAVAGVSKGMLPAKYICSNKASFCVS